jgi:hypothetical protein
MGSAGYSKRSLAGNVGIKPETKIVAVRFQNRARPIVEGGRLAPDRVR